jgi:hypothetical protein
MINMKELLASKGIKENTKNHTYYYLYNTFIKLAEQIKEESYNKGFEDAQYSAMKHNCNESK